MKTAIFPMLFKAVALITIVLAVLTLIQWVVGDAGDAVRIMKLTSMSLGVGIFLKILDILTNEKEEGK